LSTKPTAVLVCHGMGKQVPFETVDMVARALQEAERIHHTNRPEANAAIVEAPTQGGGRMHLSRVEMELTGGTVHLFEAYWAPLTEGRVRLSDVFWFLVDGGLNGLTHSSFGQGWQRRLFGFDYVLPMSRMVALQFTAAFIVFLSLVFINFVIVTVGASRLVLGPTVAAAWPTDTALTAMTWSLLGLAAGFGLLFAATQLAGSIRNRRTSYERPFRLSTPVRWLGWVLVVVGLVSPVVAALVFAVSLLGRPELVPLIGASTVNFGIFTVIVWLAAVGVSAWARGIMLQFLGDVAAYVSAYRISTLWEVREAIKRAATDVGRAVYALKDANGAQLYDHVVVVGHSLGSVVAYDLLNALLNEDIAAPSRSLAVAERTPLLLTMSSPLDKTAFVFATRLSRKADVRERLAAAKQPLITDWKHRPERWANIHTRSDWINGSLDFYDPQCDPKSPVHKAGACAPSAPCRQGGPKRVQNIHDDDAVTPLAAHNESWTTPTFMNLLYESVTRTEGRATSAGRGAATAAT